jgi:flagellar protein FliS|tara:strand:+ start:1147 stop:1548 length:402 start_codon:yes stop_codon:yes gene_type:complete
MAIHFNKAKHQYQKIEKSVVETNEPIEIVKTMIKELQKSMNIVARTNNIKEQRVKRNKHFSKSLVIIYTLQTSLDFDKGGSLATQLFQIYEYCRQQLIKGFKTHVVEGIEKAINSLREIFDNTTANNANVTNT